MGTSEISLRSELESTRSSQDREALYSRIKLDPSAIIEFEQLIHDAEWVKGHQTLVIDAIHGIYPDRYSNKIKQLFQEEDSIIARAITYISRVIFVPQEEVTNDDLCVKIKNKELIDVVYLLNTSNIDHINPINMIAEVKKLDFEDQVAFYIAFRSCSKQAKKSFFREDPFPKEIKDDQLLQAILDSCENDEDLLESLLLHNPLTIIVQQENVQAFDAIVNACGNNSRLKTALFTTSNARMNPIAMAVFRDNADLVINLLDLCKNNDSLLFHLLDKRNGYYSDGQTILHMAVKNPHILRSLLICINQHTCLMQSLLEKDLFNQTPLHMAISASQDQSVDLLIHFTGPELQKLLFQSPSLEGVLHYNENMQTLSVMLQPETIRNLVAAALKAGFSINKVIENEHLLGYILTHFPKVLTPFLPLDLTFEQRTKLLPALRPDLIIKTAHKSPDYPDVDINTLRPDRLACLVPFLSTDILVKNFKLAPYATIEQKRALLDSLRPLKTLVEEIKNGDKNLFESWEYLSRLDVESLKLDLLQNEEDSLKTEIETFFAHFHDPLDELDHLIHQAKDRAPPHYIDSITHQFLDDPYSIPGMEGKQWIDKKSLDQFPEAGDINDEYRNLPGKVLHPFTNEPVDRTAFQPDPQLKLDIKEWKRNYRFKKA